MKKTLYMSLSTHGSIDKVIKELDKYADSLEEKSKRFIKELADIGIKALEATIRHISPFYKGEDLETSSEVIQTDEGWTAIISMSGSQAVFVEFGAGVILNAPKNQSLHPKGEELGLTIGSYNPSSPNATSPYGWWYKDKWGEYQHTLGTPTFAPLYSSSLEMLSVMEQIAKDIFD